MPLKQGVGRGGGTDHIGCEEGGDDAHCHHYGIEKGGGYTQTLAKGGKDKGKFADLCQREPALYGYLQGMSGEEECACAQHRLSDKDGEGDEQDGWPVHGEHLRTDQHAYTDEENGSEEVLHTGYQMVDTLGFEGLGQNASHHECPESTGIACLVGQHHHQETQSKTGNQEGFARQPPTNTCKQKGDAPDADHKPEDEEEAQFQHTHHQLTALETCTGCRGGKDDHKEYAQKVFDNQHRKHLCCKFPRTESKVGKGLVDDGGRRHGQHASQEEAVGVAPPEHTPGCTAHSCHKGHDQTGTDNGFHPHLHNLLEREFQSQTEHQEDDANGTPRLDACRITDCGGVGHMRACQKTGHDVAEHQRLSQTTKDNGDNAGKDEYKGEVCNQRTHSTMSLEEYGQKYGIIFDLHPVF